MVWSESLLPFGELYDISIGLFRYGKLAPDSLDALMRSAGFATLPVIKRSLDLLVEVELISCKGKVYIADGPCLDKALFREELTRYIKNQLVKLDIGTLLPTDGIYDVEGDGVIVFRRSFVDREYLALLPLMEECGFLDLDDLSRSIRIPPAGIIATMMRQLSKDTLRKRSLDTLLNDLEEKRKIGLIAEGIAMNYEAMLLSGRGDDRRPEYLSETFANAGYDIASYLSTDSPALDKYIEVKAITTANHFFMSRNEIVKAEEKGDCYFLYLVDVGTESHEITVIRNPYARLISSDDKEWLKTIDGYQFEKH